MWVLIFHVESHPKFPWYTQCVDFNAFSKPEYELMYRIFGMVMMYALPFILLVVLYGSIAVELYKLSRSSATSFQTPDGLRTTVRGENIERAKVKSIQMTFVIAAAFLVCWTPYYVMCLWYWTDPVTANLVDQRIQKGLFLFASTNSTVNPIVYGVFNMKSIFGRNTTQSSNVSSTVHTMAHSCRSRRREYFSQDDTGSLRNNNSRANATRVEITTKQLNPLVINGSSISPECIDANMV
ncbi:unnamed protein product [Orchesella dallaii]|uniref:G-protein coupled receptors family 1 profile domain-containing protein n=1 Tax=Orchesella dallaii TaxID=48710 RepID=A0ABP1PJ82_9HEXA